MGIGTEMMWTREMDWLGDRDQELLPDELGLIMALQRHEEVSVVHDSQHRLGGRSTNKPVQDTL